jgi:hypothetical protein
MPDIRGGLLLRREHAIGTVDSHNKDFITTKRFIYGTLTVYLNGQILTRGVDFTEQSNQSFAMTDAPVDDLNYTDAVIVEYQQ